MKTLKKDKNLPPLKISNIHIGVKIATNKYEEYGSYHQHLSLGFYEIEISEEEFKKIISKKIIKKIFNSAKRDYKLL